MTLPLPDADLPWDVFANRELTNPQTWFSRVFKFLNGLHDAAKPHSLYWKAVAVTAHSFTVSTWTRETLDTIIFDSWNLGIATGGFKAPVTGVYFAAGSIAPIATAGNRVGAQIIKNAAATQAGGNLDGFQKVKRAFSASDSTLAPANYVPLVAGDILNICGFQDQATQNSVVSSAELRSTLTVVRVA